MWQDNFNHPLIFIENRESRQLDTIRLWYDELTHRFLRGKMTSLSWMPKFHSLSSFYPLCPSSNSSEDQALKLSTELAFAVSLSADDISSPLNGSIFSATTMPWMVNRF
jgi:hypothetical protein